jgi:hypothetical protein
VITSWQWESRPVLMRFGRLINNADTYEGFLEDFYLEDVSNQKK